MPRIFQDLAADANELLLGAMQTTSLTLEELAAGVPLPQAEPQAAEETVDPSVTRRRKRRASDSRSAVEAAGDDSAKKARAAPSGDVELVAEGSEREVSEHPKFEPEYNFREARILTTADSVARDPEIAWTLLEGIALPEDMESLPNTRMGNAVVACSSFVRAGQALRRMVTDMVELAADRKEEVRDRRIAERGLEKAKKENEELTAKLAEMVKERDEALAARTSMEAELPKKLAEAADSGFNEAGLYYRDQLPALQQKFMLAGQVMGLKAGEVKGVLAAHPVSYSQGFMAGLDAAAVPAEDPRRQNIPVPKAELQKVPTLQVTAAQPEAGPSKAGGEAEEAAAASQERPEVSAEPLDAPAASDV